ncbi:MAG: triose-phosphate isomerase [Phycisphaerae bacterium]
MRRKLVAGNWKLNLNLAAARELISQLRAGVGADPGCNVAVFPPFIYLFPAAKALDGGPIRLGAQNVYCETSGAFTGEVSPAMIAEARATYVIVGHSERRHTIGGGEDDALINRKVRAVLAAGLTPILCVGETIDERKANRTNDVLTFQLTGGLIGVEPAVAERLVIAYEPVWAIGTGVNATPQQAQEAHAHLRALVGRLLGGTAAAGVPILYGGSVNAENASQLLAQPNVDGALVGGASLKADAFLAIIRAAAAADRSK